MSRSDLEGEQGDRARAGRAGRAAPLLERLTRLGFLAKGLATILVGALALRHALGQGGRLTGQEGAIRTLPGHPFGKVALVALVVGLTGYALWMFLAAFVDPERKGTGFSGIAERVGFLVTGIGYSGGGVRRAQAAVGRHGGRARTWTTWRRRRAHSRLRPPAGRARGRGRDDGRRAPDSPEHHRGGFATACGRTFPAPGTHSPWSAAGSATWRSGCCRSWSARPWCGWRWSTIPPRREGGDEALGLISKFGEGTWAAGAVAVGLMLYGVFFVLLAWVREL